MFSQSTHASIFVFADFNVHHKDWLTFSGGTDRPDELCYNFQISNDLVQMVSFPTWIPGCDSHSPALLDFFYTDPVFVLQLSSFHWKIMIMFLSQLLLTFLQAQKGMLHFIAQLKTILVLIGAVFVIIWEMFHGSISLKLVLLLLVLNFMSGSRLELMYVALIINIIAFVPIE